jgi:hypothetical protein
MVNGTSGESGLHRRKEKFIQGLVLNLKERDHLEDMDSDEEIIFNWL